MVDVLKIFDDHGVQYVTTGKNVKKNNVNVPCPFCGDDDPSEHMGIHLDTAVWGCWRNNSHRGKNFAYLLRVLLHITLKEAFKIIGTDKPVFKEETFDQLATGDYFEEEMLEVPKRKTELDLEQFRRFSRTQHLASRRFLDYLQDDRRVAYSDLFSLVKRYHLRYAIRGDYANRIIIPVLYEDEVVTWTSRAIGNSSLRYKTLAKEDSVIPIKDIVYNFDNAAAGGTTLFITEGPIDTWKLDFYGHKRNCHSVALFNMGLEPSQLFFLMLLVQYYDRVRIVLDSGEEESAYKVLDQLQPLVGGTDISIAKLPRGFKDPGEMNKAQVQDFIAALK